MKYKIISLKNLIFILIIIVIFISFNSAKNAYLIIKDAFRALYCIIKFGLIKKFF